MSSNNETNMLIGQCIFIEIHNIMTNDADQSLIKCLFTLKLLITLLILALLHYYLSISVISAIGLWRLKQYLFTLL